MHTSLKVLAGLGVFGTVGAGSYAVSQLFSNNNEISEKLIKEGYTILTSGRENAQHWRTILNSYKTITKANSKLKFGTFTGEENIPKPEEELQKFCEKLFKSNASSNEQDNYKKAQKWCVVPITVESILKNKKYIALNTGTGDENKNEWTEKVKGLKTATKKISGLNLNQNQNEARTEEITEIKKKCADIGAKKNHESEYENNLELFSLWCANKK